MSHILPIDALDALTIGEVRATINAGDEIGYVFCRDARAASFEWHRATVVAHDREAGIVVVRTAHNETRLDTFIPREGDDLAVWVEGGTSAS